LLKLPKKPLKKPLLKEWYFLETKKKENTPPKGGFFKGKKYGDV
jgi:hypothetical protein